MQNTTSIHTEIPHFSAKIFDSCKCLGDNAHFEVSGHNEAYDQSDKAWQHKLVTFLA